MCSKRDAVCFLLAAVAAVIHARSPAYCDSALPLIAGFDAERVDAAYPFDGDDSVSEVAKLLFRVGQLERTSLQSRVDPSSVLRTGSAVDFAGEVRSKRVLQVTPQLSDYLGFDAVEVYELESRMQRVPDADAIAPILLLTSSLSGDVAPGDRLAGVGVLLELPTDSDGTRVIAAAGPTWTPKQPPVEGWRLLGDVGFDASLLPELAGRQRQRLSTEDAQAFYTMLRASSRLASKEDSLPRPRPLTAVDLLQDPTRHVGQWMSLRVETVRVTRVSLTEQPRRARQLSNDHYFQIDAIGDLGNVQLQVRSRDPDAEPVVFENRYPVSIVTPELPDFLRDEVADRYGDNTVSAAVSLPLRVHGFFFRLWSYESQYMNQRGGDDQFGPLIVGVSFKNLALAGRDPAGVSRLGWYLAAGVLIALVLIAIWSWRNRRRDNQVRRRRKETQPEQLAWAARRGR